MTSPAPDEEVDRGAVAERPRPIPLAVRAADGRRSDRTVRQAYRASPADWDTAPVESRDGYRRTLHEWLRVAYETGVQMVTGTDGMPVHRTASETSRGAAPSCPRRSPPTTS